MKPVEIANAAFPRKLFGGLDERAVRAFLSRVADYVDDLQEKLNAALQTNNRLKAEADRSCRDENTIARVMLEAEQLANRLRTEAEEAARITREMASADAERIRALAYQEAEAILAKARSEAERLESRVQHLRNVLIDSTEQVIGSLSAALADVQSIRDFSKSLSTQPGLEQVLDAPSETQQVVQQPPVLMPEDEVHEASPEEANNEFSAP